MIKYAYKDAEKEQIEEAIAYFEKDIGDFETNHLNY